MPTQASKCGSYPFDKFPSGPNVTAPMKRKPGMNLGWLVKNIVQDFIAGEDFFVVLPASSGPR